MADLEVSTVALDTIVPYFVESVTMRLRDIQGFGVSMN